jgi:glycosyltransferase involved in cell wall biosynthesis
MIVALCVLCLACAAIPAVLFCMNLREYVAPPTVSETLAAVSILIPARNEVAAIGAALSNALPSRGVEFEVVVMDDGSTDGTDAIVLAIAANDARVRLERAPALPAGWNGKQHACWALAQAAKNPVLCFVDADVSLGPDCVARMTQFMESSGSALVSGFPRQITVTFLEWMLLPLIHFVLLGFLPIGRMRRGTDPAFAAGCGQFILCRREAYFACGGHSEIKLTMHDGLLLPRLFRVAGFRTDLADITLLASCRMYTSAAQVWSGLAKNATEGLAAPARIVPISLVLLMGQMLPFLLLYLVPSFIVWYSLEFYATPRPADWTARPWWIWPLILCTVLSVIGAWLPRWLGVSRFRQDWRSALLHPFGILLLLAVQWYALLRKLRGGPVSWRGRAYAGDPQLK